MVFGAIAEIDLRSVSHHPGAVASGLEEIVKAYAVAMTIESIGAARPVG
jgi:hypothetical protein